MGRASLMRSAISSLVTLNSESMSSASSLSSRRSLMFSNLWLLLMKLVRRLPTPVRTFRIGPDSGNARSMLGIVLFVRMSSTEKVSRSSGCRVKSRLLIVAIFLYSFLMVPSSWLGSMLMVLLPTRSPSWEIVTAILSWNRGSRRHRDNGELRDRSPRLPSD